MSASTRHVARHYVEMLVAMFLGMTVLGVPAVAALSVVGMSSSELHNDGPALLLFGMAVTMTAPMVAWMRYRGHGWPACAEMTGAMFIRRSESSPCSGAASSATSGPCSSSSIS